MSSLLPGYSYDIFISYRHKDNKYDGWITEFVQNLKKELDATLKDEISIYFDFNPDDGLLESHNVDKSLEGKLKSLIFIPILSQTYCDPRSFAWQHEFCAFNEQVKKEEFGRDIHLRNGNVASRILPIRVRELDAEDKKLLEDELRGVLRPIDFIYKEQGVNRPLKPEDSEEKNLNKTKYRNQINKTANAIKEIISGLQHFDPSGVEKSGTAGRPEVALSEEKKKSKIPVYATLGLIVLAFAGYFIFSFSRGTANSETIQDKSIAVLPFEDLSAAHDQEYFSDGIAEEILNSLAHIPELKVAGRTSSFQFKGQKADLKEIGSKLNVKTVLEGSVRKMDNRVRITAQLINVENGYHIWSETYDRDLTDIFAIQDEVAQRIASVLLKELAGKVTLVKNDHTENVKAFEYYLEGKYINLHQFINDGKIDDFKQAEALFLKALALDSNYALAHAGLADLYNSYTNRVKNDPEYMRLQEKEIGIAYKLNPNLDYVNNAMGQIQLTKFQYDEAYKSFARALELNPNDNNNLFAMATLYLRMGLLDECVILMNRGIRIDPLDPKNHLIRGSALFQLAQYDDAMKDFDEAVRQTPNNFPAVLQLAYLHMIKKDMVTAKKYVDKVLALNPNVKGANNPLPMYEAFLGHKEKALSFGPDFRVYLVLGMKEEGIAAMIKLFSHIPKPLNFYLSVTRGALMSRISDDTRVRDFVEEQRKGYMDNKAKFKMPTLPE